jgi:hypothetical protein
MGVEVMSGENRRQIEKNQAELTEQARLGIFSGGITATVISAFALIFSGYSFYETVVRAPDLAVFVPPHIRYADPDRPDHPFEIFAIPLTVANDGARTGTAMAIDLEVTNLRSSEVKKFYAANLGSWGQNPERAFTPITLSGKAFYSETVQFYPRVGERVPRILDLEPGKYRLRLVLRDTASGNSWARGARPLEFEMQSGQMDYRFFSNNGTMELWAPDYRPAGTQEQ